MGLVQHFQLLLLHRVKSENPSDDQHEKLWMERFVDSHHARHGLALNTCLRELWLGNAAELSREVLENCPVEIIRGAEAFDFFLRICCGLESSITGETDVFGQVKAAWDQQNTRKFGQNSMHSLMQRAFMHSKEIRHLYLQGLGGNSYGTLARRLLKPTESEQVLILGAGQLATSVAPYFLQQPIRIINRDRKKASKLAEVLRSMQENSDVIAARNTAEEEEFWQKAKIVLLCTPPGPYLNDVQDLLSRHDHLNDYFQKSPLKILHLGCRRAEILQENIFSLDDLFELKETQNLKKALKIAMAKRACRDRALALFALEPCPLLQRQRSA